MRLLSTGIALALMLIPVSMDAKAKKKKVEPQLSALEIVEKVNKHWQKTNKPEVNAFCDNAV